MWQTVVAKYVEQHDETEAAAPIVRSQCHGNEQQQHKGDSLPKPFAAEVVDGAHTQESQKQGEKHVLAMEEEVAAVQQVPRNLGEDGEEEQIAAIPFVAAGVEEPFHQQEGKQGEAKPTDEPHKGVKAETVRPDGKEGLNAKGETPNDACGGVVNGH